MHKLLIATLLVGLCPRISLWAQFGPDPLFEKPAPLTMAEFEKTRIVGVRAVEVKDYAYDMELNRWSERHVYHALLGAGADFASIRKLAKQWLEKDRKCANPDTVRKLKWQ
jgi:hypothetical protein